MGLFQKIKEKFADKKEEDQLKTEIQKEAKKEAWVEVKPEMKEMYKKKEKDRLLGKKDETNKNWLGKLADNLAISGENKKTTAEIANMMGGVNPGRSRNDDNDGYSFKSTREVADMMGGNAKNVDVEIITPTKQKKKKELDYQSDVDEKLRRMMQR